MLEFNFKLKEQEVIPHIRLQSNQDNIVDSWDFKQRKNLVIIFYHGRNCLVCKHKLQEYNKIYSKMDDFRYLAQFLAISFDSIDHVQNYILNSSIDFPLLSDSQKHVTEKFTDIDNSKKAPYPSLFITDRFGALWFQRIVKEADQLLSAQELLDWIFT